MLHFFRGFLPLKVASTLSVFPSALDYWSCRFQRANYGWSYISSTHFYFKVQLWSFRRLGYYHLTDLTSIPPFFSLDRSLAKPQGQALLQKVRRTDLHRWVGWLRSWLLQCEALQGPLLAAFACVSNEICDARGAIRRLSFKVSYGKLWSGWWFQISFIFIPCGNDPIWLICFRWVETTN